MVVGGLRPVAIERQLDVARRVEHRLEEIPGVKLGGRATFYANGNDTAREDLLRAELLAFPLLLLLTLWVFRGFVAALLPLLVGAITVAGAFGALRLLSAGTDVSVYALNIVTALGLGLAGDYSLLVLFRYREEALGSGYGPIALKRALGRTGPTVLFSSLTVAGAAAALLVFRSRFCARSPPGRSSSPCSPGRRRCRCCPPRSPSWAPASRRSPPAAGGRPPIAPRPALAACDAPSRDDRLSRSRRCPTVHRAWVVRSSGLRCLRRSRCSSHWPPYPPWMRRLGAGR